MSPLIDDDRRSRATVFNMDVGENVRAWREYRLITQKELADEADMSASQLARVEAGERSLTLRQALKLCELLEINIDALAG